jgi:hypothetical protein
MGCPAVPAAQVEPPVLGGLGIGVFLADEAPQRWQVIQNPVVPMRIRVVGR